MSKTLLVGAGAECIEPFGLLAGKEFTFDTCYYQNEALYEALEEFYRGRLSKSANRDTGTPSSYQKLFLYSSKNVAFRKLSNYIVSASMDTFLGSQLNEHIVKSQDDDEENQLDTYGRDLLFDMLIKRDKDAGYVSALKEVALEVIPDDAYYGTIETYFSSLINPARRNKSLWRLINYYWSAFFSVAEPLIRKAFEDDRLFKQQGLYRFISNFLLFLFVLFILGLFIKENGFTHNFLCLSIIGQGLNIFDLFIVDLLWWRNTKRVRLRKMPEKELYQNPKKHIEAFIRAFIMYLLIALIDGYILTLL